MNKFDFVYEEIKNSLNTTRVSIKKINQMTAKEFLSFLREIITLFKDNNLDMNKVIISEKIDGTACRFICTDDLYFESSYSGVVTWDKMPFTEQSGFIYNTLKNKFLEIKNKVGFSYKIIGEMIWTDSLVENGKVTPVGASYLAKNFGSKGGFVTFSCKKIENNTLIDLTDTEESMLLSLIKKLSNDSFIFYDKSDIILNNINFSLNIDQISKLLQLPEYNQDRYSIKTDSAVLKSIDEIKTDISNQLEHIINNTQGRFSDIGDLIEGIVLTVKDSGNQYGIFSNGYKDMKKKYAKYAEERDAIFSNFLKNVFGYSKLSFIRKNYSKEFVAINFKDKFNNEFPNFLKSYKNCYEMLKSDSTIPLATKTAQVSIFETRIKRYESFKSFEDFINDTYSKIEK